MDRDRPVLSAMNISLDKIEGGGGEEIRRSLRRSSEGT